MHLPLLVFLSTAVLRRASAGGAYCAKTARARAAALGLDYPGTHGAPDLSGSPHNRMQPQSYLYNDGETAGTEPNMVSYGQNQPGFLPLDDRMHPRSQPIRFEPAFLPSHGIYDPEYTPNQGFSFPRGWSVDNHHPDFEEVKHVAPRAPGRPDLVYLNPHSHNKPPQFVQNGHDLVVDESVPNRRGMSLSGPPLPQSRGPATYQRGYGLGRGVPVLGSAGFANKEHSREMNRGPVVTKLKKTRIPDRLPRLLHRRINPQQFK